MPQLAYHTIFPGAHRTHSFSLHADSVDLIDINGNGWGVPLDTITTSELGANGAGSMSFRYEDPRNLHGIPAASRVRFTQWISGVEEPLFTGFITSRIQAPDQAERGYTLDITCTDLSLWLDYHVLPAYKVRAGQSDQVLIQAVIAQAMRNKDINTHSGFVTSTNSNMDAIDFSHMTLRAAIEAIQQMAGADRHYYVDFLGRFHYYQNVEAGTPAPFTITQTTPSPGGQRASTNIQIEYDDSQLISAVYITGGNKAGTGWVVDEGAVKRYGLRQMFYDAPHCKTAASKTNIGNHILYLHNVPIVRGQFEQTGNDTGWRVGQSVVITNTQMGLSAASYPIKQIDTMFNGGSGNRTRTIYFGELPAKGSGRNPIVPGAITVGTISPSLLGTEPVVLGRVIGTIGLGRDRTIL
jgi:hypothetical protein